MKTLRVYFEYILFRFFAVIVRPLSPEAVFKLGNFLGTLFYLFAGKRRRIAFVNLDIAFKDSKLPSEKKRIARKSFIFLTVSWLQCLWLQSNPSKRIHYLFEDEPEGLDIMQDCLNRNHGIFILTAHYGNWEAMGLKHGLLNISPLHSIVRRLDNPFLEKVAVRFRTVSGNSIFYKDQFPIRILRAVKSKGCVVIMLDQNTAKGGVFVDFFGKKAATARSIATFSLSTQTPILPIFCYPTDKGKYKIKYGPEIEYQPTGNKDHDVLELTQKCTSFLENKIREQPEPWMWLHRRWKTRPPEENGIKFYP